MAETMIERVARVLCERDGGDPDRICAGEGKATGQSWPAWWAYHSDARKIIEAMRAPTGEMLGNVHDTLLYHVRGEELATARLVWDRFIDVAVEDLEKPENA